MVINNINETFASGMQEKRDAVKIDGSFMYVMESIPQTHAPAKGEFFTTKLLMVTPMVPERPTVILIYWCVEK